MPPTDSSRLRRVSSRQNALVKELRHAFQKAELTPDGYSAIESVRTIEEAIRSGLRFKAVFFSDSAKLRAERLLPQLSKHTETILLPDDVFKTAVATESPQGVAALVKMPNFSLEDALQSPGEPLLVVAVGIQDPGNLGTIIRSAEAFGAGGVLAAEGTVSQFNPKVVRASAGSLFRLPVARVEVERAVQELRARGLKLLATVTHGATPIHEAELARPVAVFIGSEGAGLPRSLVQQIDQVVSIPHAARVDSLNAGIAASVVLYEAARQRTSQNRA
jgi:TrmH family RNA methyltransferase